ncbi:hypothetical protein F5X99DRAFT_410157 [Biscogniauxia marginata]|nr:hypothetical protein F5X99DRAFT_410157 [Biscogniauxia marginata]
MASTSPSFSTSFPVHLGSPDTTTRNDLRPAPLRIPQRKTETSTDDAEDLSTDFAGHSGEASIPTFHHQRMSHVPRLLSVRTVARGRATGSKLGSLVSRFEILDTVNGAESRSSHNTGDPHDARSIAVPIPSGGLKRNLQLEAMEQSLPSSMEKSQSSGRSTGISPRRGLTPATPERRSMLPISTRSRVATSKGTVESSPRHNRGKDPFVSAKPQDVGRSERKNTPVSGSRSVLTYGVVPTAKQLVYSPLSGSTKATLDPAESQVYQQRVPRSTDLSPPLLPMSKSFHEKSSGNLIFPKPQSIGTFQTAQGSSFIYEEVENKYLEDKPIKEHEPVSPQIKSTQRQKPSVADLRKSFEKISQPSTSNPTTPSSSKLHSKPLIQRSLKRSQDCARPSELFHQPKALDTDIQTQTSDDNSQIQSSPLIQTHPTALKSNMPDSLQSASSTALPVNSSSSFLLPRSSQFLQRRTILPTSNTSDTFVSFKAGPIKYEQGESEEGQYIESHEDPIGSSSKGHMDESSIFFSNEIKNSKQTVHKDPRTPTRTRRPSKSHTVPRHSSKPEPITRRSTKVSDLRKLFDRSSNRGNSPIPFMHFRRSRGRTINLPELNEPDPKSFSKESFSTLSTQATCKRRAVIPELTTEISTSDFSCNFVDKPEHPGAMVPESEYDGPADPELSVKKESPVKERIEHFERLDSGSLFTRTTPYGRAKSYDTSLRFEFGKDKKCIDKKRSVGGWRPIRERGTKMWRRMSSSFGYSIDGCNSSGNGNQTLGSSFHPAREAIQSHRLGSQQRYRRSSIFGYYLYRSSETERSTTYSSYDGSSINFGNIPIVNLENRPSHVSYTSSSPGHLPMRKSFPLRARRISDHLRLSSGFSFGLDGALQTKVAKDGDHSPSEGTSEAPGPSILQGGPHALSKAISKQSAAERWRRRQEEKKFRRGQKAKRKEGPIQAKKKWKGKEKASALTDSEEEEDDTNQARRNDKGKGKEVEGQPKDKAKREGSWSKKTASGFVVHQATDLKLRHPKPRRPGQVKQIVNMYMEKASSGIKIAAKAASQHSVNNSNSKGGSSSNVA